MAAPVTISLFKLNPFPPANEAHQEFYDIPARLAPLKKLFFVEDPRITVCYYESLTKFYLLLLIKLDIGLQLFSNKYTEIKIKYFKNYDKIFFLNTGVNILQNDF